MKSLALAALALATSLTPATVSAAGLSARIGQSGAQNIEQTNALQRGNGERRNQGYGDRAQRSGNTEWRNTERRNTERQGSPRVQTEQQAQQPRVQAQPQQQQQQYRQEARVQTQTQAQPQDQRNRAYSGQPNGASSRYDRNDNRGNDYRGSDQRYDRGRDIRVAPRYDRNDNGYIDRRYDQKRDGRVDRNNGYNNNNRYNGGNNGNWNRSWQNDRRYDWRSYRNNNRNYYRVGRYSAPYRGYNYSRLNIGFYLGNGFYGSNYWISDPSYYRLPTAYGAYRWVRYYDDVLLIDIRNGYVVDVVYDFFW